MIDEEKPFLHHLEDLRKMMLKTILTLIVSMFLCFSFSQNILDFLRAPAERVWTQYESQRLPTTVDVDQWVKAKLLVDSLLGLPEKARNALMAREPKEIQDLAEADILLKAMRTLPQDEQESFVREVSETPEIAQLVFELEKTEALTQLGETGKGGVRMMSALQPAEPFNLSLKLAFYAGVVVSFPLLLYFLLEFIVPGLHRSEKKALYHALFYGFGLFLLGVSFAYYVVLPQILNFFFGYAMTLGIANDWRIGFYLTFILQFILLFGLSFELPIVVMPFVKLGVLTYDMMRGTRSYAIVAIAVLSAILTPQDILSMFMMGVPLYILYEICIFLAKRHALKVAREEAEETERLRLEWEEGRSVYQSVMDSPTDSETP